jgi:hypothetical protein
MDQQTLIDRVFNKSGVSFATNSNVDTPAPTDCTDVSSDFSTKVDYHIAIQAVRVTGTRMSVKRCAHSQQRRRQRRHFVVVAESRASIAHVIANGCRLGRRRLGTITLNTEGDDQCAYSRVFVPAFCPTVVAVSHQPASAVLT